MTQPTIKPTNAETCREFINRLNDPKRWKLAISEVLMWFLFGILITSLLAKFTPGYPIIVGTPSIPTGVYWLNKNVHTFNRGDAVTFSFEPTQEWLKGRYGRELVHTKIVLGVAGDTVSADSEQRLTICRPLVAGVERVCTSAGQVQKVDSKNRPLFSWVPVGHAYTLQPGELWVFAPHPKSLDSRYHGPIASDIVHGRATSIFLW